MLSDTLPPPKTLWKASLAALAILENSLSCLFIVSSINSFPLGFDKLSINSLKSDPLVSASLANFCIAST